jgi:hypothetical protein
MVVPRQNLVVDASLSIDGQEFALDDKAQQPSHGRESVPTQPGDSDVEFERRIINLARGWGESRYTGAGGYDYGTANMHRRMSFLPGATITARTHATPPIGDVSFCEYWDGTAANRRLVIVSPRHVYEVDPAGAQSVADLGAGFTTAKAMTKGVRFRTGAMASPKIFIARQSATATDYMVSRTGAGTYAVSANSKYGGALGKGKDSAGADVLWRIDENGKLNQSVANSDPDAGASWSGASYPNSLYPIGEGSTRVNDLVQQNRAMVCGKADGAYLFDNVLNVIPVTPGMEQTLADGNFKWFKDANGMAIAPTAQGLIWIDGLEWGTCGPVSSNPEARNLRGTEVAVSDQAGNYIYAAVLSGGTSYIFLGTPRKQGDNGQDPFTWHGPIASVAQTVTDLRVSTVYGTKLWIGWNLGWGTLELNPDFSPKSDLATGYIYLPEGILDMSGPGVIKDLRKAEFIAPADAPFAAANQWRVEANIGAGWVAIDGSYVTSGVYAERYWSTETSHQRPRLRISYASNAGAAELEQVIIRGTERPETTDEYTWRIVCKDSAKTPLLKKLSDAGLSQIETLRAAVDAGRKSIVSFGETTFTGRVTHVSDVAKRTGSTGSPEWVATIRVRRVKVA